MNRKLNWKISPTKTQIIWNKIRNKNYFAGVVESFTKSLQLENYCTRGILLFTLEICSTVCPLTLRLSANTAKIKGTFFPGKVYFATKFLVCWSSSFTWGLFHIFYLELYVYDLRHKIVYCEHWINSRLARS